uniref:Uncharacterized protein n=1 Tax=Wuchereria bancrofti TaxID=6293 RepID=A0A1I8EPM6_WUCBA
MRVRANGVYHAQLCRFHDMFSAQLIMCVTSCIIYGRIKELVQPIAFALQDLFKTSALLSIFFSHASLVFFYIYLPDGSLISTIW